MRKIQILGTGCPKCRKLEQAAREAADELDIEYELNKVEDMNEIISFGVMMTPALVVDDVVKVSGKIPNMNELKEMIA